MDTLWIITYILTSQITVSCDNKESFNYISPTLNYCYIYKSDTIKTVKDCKEFDDWNQFRLDFPNEIKLIELDFIER